ncbi:MAG: beta-lactamase family protein [Burkholderiales bacterium]|nr:beta-lactamase family protein [Burkholderiales bacterium]MCL4687918.1 beta-lactamase family protein [Burkholderiales bacterium]
MASGHAVGVAAGVIHPDGRLEVVTAGVSGNDERPRLDAQTLFEIGSITKVFTATLLAQRIERGELAPGTTVRQAAPRLRDWRSPGVGDVTLEALATHTAGLSRLPKDPWLAATALLSRQGPYGGYSADRFLDFAAAADAPGPGPHRYAYSNYGAALLGEVLARREGLAWSALVRRDILDPLGMARTGVDTRDEDAALLARGHDDSLRPAGYWAIPGMGGAGALRSNVDEMAVFLMAQRMGALAGARLTQQPRGKAWDRNETGLGWVIRPGGKGRILWHNGGTGGFRSFAGFHEASGLAVVVLSNTAASVDDIGLHVLDETVALAPEGRKPPLWRFGVTAVIALTIVWTAWRARPASRVDALWAGLELALAALVLHLLAPWGWMPAFAWPALAAVFAGSLLAVARRAMALPWREPGGKWRFWRSVGRGFTALVFAACLVHA